MRIKTLGMRIEILFVLIRSNYSNSFPKEKTIIVIMYMKKMYVRPQVEVVKITQCVTLLNGSGPEASAASGNGGFESVISGSSGSGRSRGCDWDDEW